MSERNTTAAVLTVLGQPLELRSLTVPDPGAGQVLVDVAYSGVCHSQLHEVRGRRGPDRFLPHTLGHEGAGRVLAVGSGVTKVAPGDHVVMTWIRGSGADVPAASYRDSTGVVNSGAISTFMKQALISENRVVRIGREVPLRAAALLGCAIPTGAGVALSSLAEGGAQSVAIFGVGGIGLSAVIGAVLRGAAPIIAVDVSQSKLELAKRAGATHLIDASHEDVSARIKEATQNKGVDVAIEAAGTAKTMETALRVVRDRGGVSVVAGNLAQGGTFAVDPMDLIRGKQLRGTWGGETDPDRDIPMYAGMISSGKLDLEWLITHEYPLEGINAALDDLEGGKVGRAMIALV